MPYATCPNCKSSFHLLVTRDIDAWDKAHPVADDGNRYIECFQCWKKLAVNDRVEIWKVPDEYNGRIKPGDLGKVVLTLNNETYEVECCNENGTAQRRFAIPRKYLKYVPNKQ